MEIQYERHKNYDLLDTWELEFGVGNINYEHSSCAAKRCLACIVAKNTNLCFNDIDTVVYFYCLLVGMNGIYSSSYQIQALVRKQCGFKLDGESFCCHYDSSKMIDHCNEEAQRDHQHTVFHHSRIIIVSPTHLSFFPNQNHLTFY